MWTACEERKPLLRGLRLNTGSRWPAEAQVPAEHALQEAHDGERGAWSRSPPSLHHRPSLRHSGFEGSHTPIPPTPLSARLLNSAAEAERVGLTYCKTKTP